MHKTFGTTRRSLIRRLLAAALFLTTGPLVGATMDTGAGALGAQANARDGDAPATAPAPGMLRVGDRIVLSVEMEEALTDTFTVRPGYTIDLPVLGSISLAGVRREDVESHLQKEIGRFIKEPVVHAQTLVRIAVLGEVATPGFFAVPANAPLADAITLAGGPTSDAELKKMEIMRRGKTIEEGQKVRTAVSGGYTLDDMGLQAGDELVIPRKRDSERMVRILSLLVAIPLTVVAITRF